MLHAFGPGLSPLPDDSTEMKCTAGYGIYAGDAVCRSGLDGRSERALCHASAPPCD